MEEPVFNSHTRIWFFDRSTGRKRYGTRVGAGEINVKKHSIELQLNELVTKAPGSESALLQFFEPSMDIHITHCEVGRPDEYKNNTPILTLRNCSFNLSWIDDPVVTQSADVQPWIAFLIVESWDYEWAKTEE